MSYEGLATRTAKRLGLTTCKDCGKSFSDNCQLAGVHFPPEPMMPHEQRELPYALCRWCDLERAFKEDGGEAGRG